MLGKVTDELGWALGAVCGAVIGLMVEGLWGVIRARSRRVPPLAARLLAAAVGLTVGIAAIAVVVAGGGSSASDDAVEVMVVWEEGELAAFRDVVSRYPGGDVVVLTTGTDIGEDLDQRFAADDPPDVAIVPQPRLVQHYAQAGQIVPVADEVAGHIPEAWNALVTTSVDGEADRVYGAWVKGSYKSLFWYRADLFPTDRHDPDDQGTDPARWVWTDLTEWVRDHTGTGPAEAPLTLPAKDCWPLTDWFENQLAAIDPDVYDQLAAGELRSWDQQSVRDALDELGDLWSQQRNGVSAVRGGPDGATNTVWQELPRQVAEGDAALAFGPSFLAGQVQRLPHPEVLKVFPYPRVGGGDQPVVVGGDVAVVPRQPSGDESRGARFVRWLMDQPALRAWSESDPGYMTPNDRSPMLPDAPATMAGADELLRPYLTQLLRQPPGGLHFDLSDQFGVVTDGEPGGVSEILYDFFRAVTGGDDIKTARDRAVARLDAEAGGQSQLGDDCD